MEPILYELFSNIEEHHWWWRSRRSIVNRLLNHYLPPPGLKAVLDMGCGFGTTLQELPPQFARFGAELEPKAVEACHKKGLSHVVLTHDNKIPFETNCFDATLMLDVLEHIDAQEQMLREVWKVTKMKGYLLITVPAFKWLWTQWDDLNMHKRRYKKDQLIKTVQACGFQVLWGSYFNFFLLPFAVARLMTNTWKKKSKGALPAGAKIPPSFINSMFNFVFSSEGILLEYGLRFPVGSSLILFAQKNEN